MRILIYYQNPYRTIFIESLVQSFIQKGNEVYFLTTCGKGILHEKMSEYGAYVFENTSYNKGIRFYIDQFFFLVRFCWKYKIHIVYSHLQLANLIAVLSQFFVLAKVFPCRHHADDVMISGNRNAKKLDKLVNFFSKKIIVVSEAVKHQMINSESMNTGKIKTISLGYNFDLYDKPFENNLKDLKSKVNSSFIAIIISRMNENKRHILAFNAINRLVKENYNIKLIVLDTGPKENELKEYVKTENLVDRIIFTGFLNNTIDYLAISNVLIHPSISEASNQVVKEAAMLEIPSIVCHNVGDFDEYIVDKINGFLVNKLNPEDCIYNILKDYYSKKNELKKMGVSIKKDVLKSFNIDNVSDKYLNLSNES